MQEILHYSLLSWYQFIMIAIIAAISLLVAHRFHLFKRHTWDSSIGYHVFFCVILCVVTISFLAINPFFHLIFLLVVFGFIWKNILSYIKSIFNLYFSNIHMGDRIKIGDVVGRLTNINLGGMHISSDHQKTFFSFSNWKGGKIELLSEEGKVPVALNISDQEERSNEDSIFELEKRIFEFPFLTNDKIKIQTMNGEFDTKTTVSSQKYKGSLIKNIEKAGFDVEKASN